MNLVLHETTVRQLDRLAQTPPHAILLVGPKGSGKRAVADRLVSDILGIAEPSAHPYGKIIAPMQDKSIGIETIRELEHFLSLKVPGKTEINRFVIIEDAHLLTAEAQNSLLKTLEEPPAGSMLVLTAAHEQALLPTVRSRAQTVRVNSPDSQKVKNFFTVAGHPQDEVSKAAAISGGLPGLMHTLLNDKDNSLSQATDYARQILSKTTYERLLMVDMLSKDRGLSLNICFILQQMAHISLQKAEGQAAARWQNILEVSYRATEALSRSAQPKLVLDDLMLNL